MKRVKDEQGREHVELTAEEARQGRLGKPLLYVLLCGLVGSVVVLLAAGLIIG